MDPSVSTSGVSVADVVIVGGGIVGMASAFVLGQRNPDLKVVLIEKETELAQHQTGHNSGVMHSGVYYKPGSLKAKFCVEGLEKMKAFAEAYGVDYDVCGKVIVATREDALSSLETIAERGKANGVEGLQWLDDKGVKEREPHVRALAGLLVPSTGIIDYQKVTQTMAKHFLEHPNHSICYGQEVLACRRGRDGVELSSKTQRWRSKLVVNCGGLQCDRLAEMADDDPQMRIVPFRGDYYELSAAGRSKVKHLIYPVPNPNFPFLGVHFTRMIGGRVECGPNAVFSFEREGYTRSSFDARDTFRSLSYSGTWKLFAKHWQQGMGEMRRAFSKKLFLASLQEMIPDLTMQDIKPCRSGVRAVALNPSGTFMDDFHFVEREGVLHVLNTPSPAATSSLSIAETVMGRVVAMMNRPDDV